MRPFKTIPEFEALTPTDLEQVHHLLRTCTYAEARNQIADQFGITLSTNKLFRYLRSLERAEELTSLDEDLTLSVNDYVNLLNGQPVPFSSAGLQIILKRAFELAVSPSTSPSLLKDLFRLFTYQDRQALAQRRLDLAERLQKLREDKAAENETKRWATAEEERALIESVFGEGVGSPGNEIGKDVVEHSNDESVGAQSNQCDPSNPFGTTSDNPNSEFQLPPGFASPIPFKFHYPAPRRSTGGNIEDPHFSSGRIDREEESPTPSAPPIPEVDPAALAAATYNHTCRRATGYIKRQPGQPAPWRDETWILECPCGQEHPCAAHPGLYTETRYMNPAYSDYAAALARHNLPFTAPQPGDLPTGPQPTPTPPTTEPTPDNPSNQPDTTTSTP